MISIKSILIIEWLTEYFLAENVSHLPLIFTTLIRQNFSNIKRRGKKNNYDNNNNNENNNK